MKKLLVVLLALTMVFAFAACGQEADTATDTEGLTVIPLGGNLEDVDVSAYGSYTQIDLLPELADGMEEGDEIECYYSENSEFPYIAVLHIPQNGKTMAEYADGALEATGAVAWLDIEEEDSVAYQCGTTLNDGNYYYVDCVVWEDGDSFVQIDFFKKCEEVALGDSGQYLWIPTGYTDLMNDDEVEHGAVFCGEYDESYCLPQIWVGPYPDDYEGFCWYWDSDFEEIPVDEATYNAWVKANWDKASCEEYYEAFGITDLNYYEGEANGLKVDVYAGSYNNGFIDDIFIQMTDGTYYNIFLFSTLDPAPVYAKVLTDSLHTK